MNNLKFKLEDWLPMNPDKGPPLPRFLAIYWPWREEKVPPPPPLEYQCPYCEKVLATYEELVAHVQSVHPGERIPIPIEWES